MKFSRKEQNLINKYKNGEKIVYDDYVSIFDNLEKSVDKKDIKYNENVYYAQKLVFIHKNNKLSKNTKYYQNHINY